MHMSLGGNGVLVLSKSYANKHLTPFILIPFHYFHSANKPKLQMYIEQIHKHSLTEHCTYIHSRSGMLVMQRCVYVI